MPATAATVAPDAGARIAAALAAVAILLAAASPAIAATARIQYLSSSAVYLDAGSDAGLATGMQVQVERDGKPIATLVVDFVARNSASCRVLAASDTLRAGDAVRFTPAGATAPPPAAPPAPAPIGSAWSPRGRIGMLFLRSEDASGRFDNPMLWAELAMNGSGQKQIGFRFRGDSPQRTLDAPAAGSGSRQARVYEAALRYRSAARRVELEAGRLLPPRLELVGTLDGGAVLWRPGGTWRLGVAGGRGTEYATAPFVSAGTKAGGFIELGAGGRHRVSLAFGHVDDADMTRRNYLQLRADAAWRRARLFENLEVDFAPSWKKDLGEETVALTALALGGQVFVRRDIDVAVGFESRRALLVPEQRLLPSVEPRPLRNSVRAATRFGLTRRWSLRLGGDVRRAGDSGSIARSWDAQVAASRLGPAALSLHLSAYDGEQAEGEVLDGSLFLAAGARTRLHLAGGGNRTRTPAGMAGASEPESRWGWLRAGVGVEVGRGLRLGGAGEWRSHGAGRELTFELEQGF